MPAAFPAGGNVFVKDHRATGALVVDYSRNMNDFALNRYVQIRNVAKESGYYLEMTVEEAGRVLNTDLVDFVWPDGQDRPLRNEGTESFNFKAYQTQRYDYGFNLGDKAVDQADWDIVAGHSRIKAQQAMTARTQLALAALTNTDNYDASHTSDVDAISGNTGSWAESTAALQDIKRSLNHAAKIIKRDTLGAVKARDLKLVLGPDTAMEVAQSPEVVEHIKHSQHSLAQIRGEQPGRNVEFGLPDFLYGYEVAVEDAVKVTTHKGASSVTRSYLLGSGEALLVARPGDLMAPGGGPSFSTIMIFAYEELTVETLHDQRNRRTEGHVVDDISVVMTAPATGFYFTSAV
ncbi:hypothetical protein [Lignipirellula cremea]|uniref:Phage capsid family protein n=1 Tax=Lignipirellula cremea TaxID=2528010 RepID=A0A518E0D0_9BACT|nr:hypothetical protein [Lignipirellula cremea]QDU97529.1 hypothetical protein Pla8534_53770 [Lignipirellula cremea]